MAVTANFLPSSGVLSVFGDSLDNTITTSRNAAGKILVNGGAVADRGRHRDGRQHRAACRCSARAATTS